eukprot:TRINITY_DN21769_c1_g1_i1.p1 TRINITY_DN21769_c1_g1~~TRINITY_DN21769_c1_g1_i1.p1  ORF type:complete len:353 (-),score=88.48 TRINITY_DN21769_c1_g1_i1:250-1308(-)
MNGKATGRVYLVTGGEGFLGRYIVEQLINRGEQHVRVFDLRKTYDNPKKELILGDISKLEDVKKACKGVNVVIHTVSPSHGAATWDFLHRINVIGTQNVLEACQSEGVSQLIYTSSASVVFDGSDIRNGNEETLSYPKVHMDNYNHTKQLAEELVLQANGKSGVMTASIRPSGIFGPRDVQAWPGFVSAAKEKILGKWNKSIMQIGDGKNTFDWTYVENVAHAHLLISDRLTNGSHIGGQAYFITNDEHTPFWDMASYVYAQFGYPTPSIFIPTGLMIFFAQLVAFFVMILSPFVKLHPTFTVLRIRNATSNRTFSCDKAKRDFGYAPQVSLEEGKKRALAYFKNERSQGRF